MGAARPTPGWTASALIALVRGYQRILAPLLGGQCRYSPSCSVYAIEALEIHGAWRGTMLAVRRLGRCHPWGGCGDDPVPPSRADAAPSQDPPSELRSRP
ncbi:MAG: membrane protein insertion efficiency factor YidD [Phycisphaerales bacterium]|nr:membrane protein insertion efficiency factor YidD [Phycisphaerales bacterium]